MGQPPVQGEPAALQERIRRAGRRTAGRRLRLVAEVAILGALVAFGMRAAGDVVRREGGGMQCGTCRPRVFGAADWATQPGLLMGGGGALGLLLALPLGTAVRARYRRRLRRELLALAVEERAPLLEPLRREGGDTAALAAALLRDVTGTGAELAPSASPAGRGDEPASSNPT